MKLLLTVITEAKGSLAVLTDGQIPWKVKDICLQTHILAIFQAGTRLLLVIAMAACIKDIEKFR